MAAVGGQRPTVRGPAYRHPSLLHQPPRLAPPDCTALCLELLGHAATPIALPRLRCNRFHPCHQLDLLPIHGRGSVALYIRVKSAPTHLEHRTEDRHRPGRLMLRHKGVAQFGSLTKKRMAFFKISRSIFSRLFSSRSWRSASWSGVRRPLPGNAAVAVVVYSCFHRRSILTLTPKFRAVSATP